MPHFSIECPATLEKKINLEEISLSVHNAAINSNLFNAMDVKTRLIPVHHVVSGNNNEAFIHVNCSIMEGRTNAQKKSLGLLICSALTELLPEIKSISVNTTDLIKESYASIKK